jgi:hypothetical protein
MTTKQLEAALNAEAARLDRVEANLAETRRQYQVTLNGDAGEAVREAMAEEFEPTLAKAEADAAAAAGIAAANANLVIDQLSANRPALSDAETALANNRREFVKEDVEEATIPDLIDSLRHALMTEDRPGLYLYTRYLPKRLQTPASSDWGDTTSSDDVDTLRSLLREAQGKLRDTSLDPIQKRAAEIRSRAYKIEGDAGRRAQEARTFSFQSANEVKW